MRNNFQEWANQHFQETKVIAEILQEYPSKGKTDMQTILKRISLVFDQEQDIFVERWLK